MREKICTMKCRCGSKRRPKVMTGIVRTHPTSVLPQKKRYEYSVLLFYQHESHLKTASMLQLALLPRFSLLILTQPTRGGWGGDLSMVGLLNCGPTLQ